MKKGVLSVITAVVMLCSCGADSGKTACRIQAKTQRNRKTFKISAGFSRKERASEQNRSCFCGQIPCKRT